MEPLKKDEQKITKRKKASFLTRLGQRISKAFSRSKSSKGAQGDSSKTCLDDLPVTSQSHDDLQAKDQSYPVKRKKFGRFLSISPKNDRCLSEGDLTRNEDKFYSGDSSPKPNTGREHDDLNEDGRQFTQAANSVPLQKDKKNFKNELALRLKNRNPTSSKKDDESDSSKTPDSPPGNCSGTSPSRQIFNGSRTPYSLSSLSHSSNSLSGNAAGTYPTSDGESMSRSVIDSTDDIGVNVDLTTPLSKTTTAGLLDSTAAHQKIAASRPRRARPKASDHGKPLSADKSKESGKFSPVRETRDMLEEISEEDSQPASNSPTIMEEDPIGSNTESTDNKLVIIRPEESEKDDQSPIDRENVPLKMNSKSDSQDQSVLDIRQDENISKEPSINIDSTNVNNDDSVKPVDSSVNNTHQHHHQETSVINNEPKEKDETQSSISSFQKNKLKFQNTEKSTLKGVTLRPINTREANQGVTKCTSWAPATKNQTDSKLEITTHHDNQIDQKPVVNRYIPMRSTKNVTSEPGSTLHTNDTNPKPTVSDLSRIKSNTTTFPDNRKSRVMDMIKNLESSASN